MHTEKGYMMQNRILNIPAKEEEIMRRNLSRAILRVSEGAQMSLTKYRSKTKKKESAMTVNDTGINPDFPSNMNEIDRIIYKPLAFKGNTVYILE
jgi:hypothetical protein